DCVENIDIGGVAMIRAAAKNHDAVTVVTHSADYGRVLAEMAAGGGTVGAEMRRSLAHKAFALTAAYDAAIAEWMGRDEPTSFPETLILTGHLADRLRYGENPPQSAAFYRTRESPPGLAIARLLIEVVIVPEADEAALAILARRTALRLLVTGEMPEPAAAGRSFRTLAGGILVQERDRVSVGRDGLRTVTRREPSETEIS